MQPEVFWGLTGTAWTAIVALATIALAVATVAVAWVAGYQIAAARKEAEMARIEAKKARTLEVVSRYDHDYVLDCAIRRLARARDEKKLYDEIHKYRVDFIAVFNYFETIAIGIQQGMFIEEMARDFMEHIVRFHIEEARKEKLFEKLATDRRSFEHIFALNEKWKPTVAVYFKGDGSS
jgi:hypothetical protein